MKTIHEVLRLSETEPRGAYGEAFVQQGKEVQEMLDLVLDRIVQLTPRNLPLARVSDIRALWGTHLQRVPSVKQVPFILLFHQKAALRALMDSREEGQYGFNAETEHSLLDALSIFLLDCPWPADSDHLSRDQCVAFLEILRAQWDRLNF